jgi:hypothetical protein
MALFSFMAPNTISDVPEDTYIIKCPLHPDARAPPMLFSKHPVVYMGSVTIYPVLLLQHTYVFYEGIT